MNILLNLLILVIAAVIVFMVAKYIMGEAELAPPIRQIVLLILGLAFLIWLFNIITMGRIWPLVQVV